MCSREDSVARRDAAVRRGQVTRSVSSAERSGDVRKLNLDRYGRSDLEPGIVSVPRHCDLFHSFVHLPFTQHARVVNSDDTPVTNPYTGQKLYIHPLSWRKTALSRSYTQVIPRWSTQLFSTIHNCSTHSSTGRFVTGDETT